MELNKKIDLILNEKSAYDKYFEAKLKEWGIKSPAELSKKEKIKFFDAVDKGWKSDKEKK